MKTIFNYYTSVTLANNISNDYSNARIIVVLETLNSSIVQSRINHDKQISAVINPNKISTYYKYNLVIFNMGFTIHRFFT